MLLTVNYVIELRVRSVAPSILDFRGFKISIDGLFGGCLIASKIPMDDQIRWTTCMDFRELSIAIRYAIFHIVLVSQWIVEEQ